MTAAAPPVFVSPGELARLCEDAAPVTVLEVRYARDGGTDPGPDRHLPGAVPVDLATELADPSAPATAGRRPLPDPAALQASARRWGLREGSTVVVYDDRCGLVAARAWWVLRWAGLDRVAVLDGGLGAWIAGGRPTGETAGEVPPGDLRVRPGGLPELDADGAAELAAHGRLLDARSGDDHRAGHIPGARSVPAARALGPDGRLLPPSELRALYRIGAGPAPGLSCGGGVAGAFGVAVLAHLGVTAPLYVGSFSAWSADPARPVAGGVS